MPVSSWHITVANDVHWRNISWGSLDESSYRAGTFERVIGDLWVCQGDLSKRRCLAYFHFLAHLDLRLEEEAIYFMARQFARDSACVI